MILEKGGNRLIQWWFSTGQQTVKRMKIDRLFLEAIATWWLENSPKGFVGYHMSSFLDVVDAISDLEYDSMTKEHLIHSQNKIQMALEKLQEANNMCRIIFQKKYVTDGDVAIPCERKQDLGIFLVRATNLAKQADTFVEEILRLIA